MGDPDDEATDGRPAPSPIGGLCEDLLAETGALDDLIGPLEERRWAAPTPAPGWSVRDQLTHLAFFDDVTVQALREPEAFLAGRDEVLADVDAYTSAIAHRYADLPGIQVLEWFGRSRRALLHLFETVDAKQRIPWYGPDMSAASALTARIMETWAHGQDVADAVGAAHRPTSALRQVAHLGVRTLPNSFRSQGRPVPAAPVRVELVAPEGARWEWGPAEADQRVLGPAVDFCLVVTQRCHVADTGLEVRGEIASEWLTIAQAFAGPPGEGRAPGARRA